MDKVFWLAYVMVLLGGAAVIDMQLVTSRDLLLDPSDILAFTRHVVAQSRTQGPNIYLSILREIALWDSVPMELKRLASVEVSRLLGNEFSCVGLNSFSCNGLSHSIAVYQHRKTGLRLLLIPGRPQAQCFECCGQGYFHENFSECPRCRGDGFLGEVSPFLISQSVVSSDEWSEVSGNYGEARPKCDERVENSLLWLEKRSLRVPTEDEWNYSCSGTSTTKFFWGDHLRPSYTWYKTNSNEAPKPARLHRTKTNAFGLIDAVGNVWEIAGHSDCLVARGGSYCSEPEYLTIASRVDINEDSKSEDLGFRAAMSMPDC